MKCMNNCFMSFPTLSMKRKIHYMHPIAHSNFLLLERFSLQKKEILEDKIPGATSYKNAKQLEYIQEFGPKVFGVCVIFGNL